MPASNWGRWGPEDERGAANLIDSAAVRRACASVESGRVYPLGIEVNASGPVVGGRRPPLHLMSADGGDYVALERDHGYADDYLSLATHGTSHIDALSHIWHEGSMYNGFPMSEVRSSGAARCAVDKIGALVTPAHLISVAGGDGAEVGAAELESLLAERDVGPGDALLIHTGWMRGWKAGENVEASAPALAADAASVIAERNIALVGADNPAVERYPQDELHVRLIRDCGVYLMELLSLDDPVADGVETGCLVTAPLLISRGVGSPVNPVLIV